MKTAFMALLIGLFGAGCGGGSGSEDPAVRTGQPATDWGTGTLVVTATKPDGEALPGAAVLMSSVSNLPLASQRTDRDGVATFTGVGSRVVISVRHDFGVDARARAVDVAPLGPTRHAVILQPARPRPSIALLPVRILPGSVSSRRNELTLELSVVASAAAPFVPLSSSATPYLTTSIRDDSGTELGSCSAWTDLSSPATTCSQIAGDAVQFELEQFSYDPRGRAPLPPTPGPSSVALVLDQSRRVASLDPDHVRSFALRQFVGRMTTAAAPKAVAITGLAGSDANLTVPFALPQQPLWSALGAAAAYSTDRVTLETAVNALQPLVGGSAPVFDALTAAIALSDAQAPAGTRALIAFLGGGDDRALTGAERTAALSALRQRNDSAGTRAIVVAAIGDGSLPADSRALADLANALRAPTISFGVSQSITRSWASGSFGALDLAADFVEGTPLPTISVTLRVRANHDGAFAAGAKLRGVVFVQSEICDWDCFQVPVEFAADIP
jgi:hypothetical protein